MTIFSYIVCICCDILEKNDGLILFLFGTVISNQICLADASKIAFGYVPNLSNYGNIFLTFMCLLLYLGEKIG